MKYTGKKRIFSMIFFIVLFFNLFTSFTVGANQPPDRPDPPGGNIDNWAGSQYLYIAFAYDPDENQYRLQWDMGDGSIFYSDYVASGEDVYNYYTWTSAGTFQVKVRAEDIYGAQSAWSYPLTVTVHGNNSPPYMPVITGSTNGDIGVLYEFSISTTDPNNNHVKYIVEWDDGDTLDTGFYPSGQIIRSYHSWLYQGTYTIRGKAQDTYYATSPWSAPLTIQIGPGENAPPAVNLLSVTALSSSSISAVWTQYSGNNFQKYYLEYTTDYTWTTYNSVPIYDKSIITMTINNLQPVTPYFLRVEVFVTTGYSPLHSVSNVRSAITPYATSPPAVNLITVTPTTSTTITATWTQYTGQNFQKYLVQYTTDNTWTQTYYSIPIFTQTTTTTPITNLAPQTTYYIRISAIATTGYDPLYAYSNVKSTTTTTQPPTTPPPAVNLQSVTSTSVTSLNVRWTEYIGSNFQKYVVQYTTDSTWMKSYQEISINTKTTTQLNLSNLQQQTLYFVRICVSASSGYTPLYAYSNVLSATPQSYTTKHSIYIKYGDNYWDASIATHFLIWLSSAENYVLMNDQTNGYQLADIIISIGDPLNNDLTATLNTETLIKGWGFKNGYIYNGESKYNEEYTGIIGSLKKNNKTYVLIYGIGEYGTLAAARRLRSDLSLFLLNEKVVVASNPELKELFDAHKNFFDETERTMQELVQRYYRSIAEDIYAMEYFLENYNKINKRATITDEEIIEKAILKVALDYLTGVVVNNVIGEPWKKYLGNKIFESTEIESEIFPVLYQHSEDEYLLEASHSYLEEAIFREFHSEIATSVMTKGYVQLYVKKVLLDPFTTYAIGKSESTTLKEMKETIQSALNVNNPEYIPMDSWASIYTDIKNNNLNEAITTVSKIMSFDDQIDGQIDLLNEMRTTQIPSLISFGIEVTINDVKKITKLFSYESSSPQSLDARNWNNVALSENKRLQMYESLKGEASYLKTIDDIFSYGDRVTNFVMTFNSMLGIVGEGVGLGVIAPGVSKQAVSTINLITGTAIQARIRDIAGEFTENYAQIGVMYQDLLTTEAIYEYWCKNQALFLLINAFKLPNTIIDYIKIDPNTINIQCDKTYLQYGLSGFDTLTINIKDTALLDKPVRYKLLGKESRKIQLVQDTYSKSGSITTSDFFGLNLHTNTDGSEMWVTQPSVSGSWSNQGDKVDITLIKEVQIDDVWVPLPTSLYDTKMVTIYPSDFVEIYRAPGYDGHVFFNFNNNNCNVYTVEFGFYVQDTLGVGVNDLFSRYFVISDVPDEIYGFNPDIWHFPIKFAYIKIKDNANTIYDLVVDNIRGLPYFDVIASSTQTISQPDIWEQNRGMFSLWCPADMLIIDEHGHQTGHLPDGSSISEIPDAFKVYGPDKGWVVPANHSYTIKVFGKDTGLYTLTLSQPTENGHETLQLNNVNVVNNTIDTIRTDVISGKYSINSSNEKQFDLTLQSSRTSTNQSLSYANLSLLPSETQYIQYQQNSTNYLFTVDKNNDGKPDVKNQMISTVIEHPVAWSFVKNIQIISGILQNMDEDNPVTLFIQIDNGSWIKINTQSNWNYSWDTTNVSNGVHSISLKVQSQDKSISYESSVNVIVDNQDINGNVGGITSKTPGFELLCALCAITIILLYCKRKKIKPL